MRINLERIPKRQLKARICGRAEMTEKMSQVLNLLKGSYTTFPSLMKKIKQIVIEIEREKEILNGTEIEIVERMVMASEKRQMC